MRIAISGKNIEITDTLRARIEKKVGKLDKYLREDTDVQVKLSQERPNRNTAEITITLNGAILRVEETSPDMYASIDAVQDKIIRKIRRHRTKLEKRLRVDAFDFEQADAALTEPEPEEGEHALVRVKRFAVKPMTVDDAIAQMEMLSHSFFLFLDAETGATCVVYRREDGNYGLLQPENA